MKKFFFACLFLLLICTFLGCSSNQTEENISQELQDSKSEFSLVKIFVDGEPVPYFIRTSAQRARETLAKDFSAVLNATPGFVPFQNWLEKHPISSAATDKKAKTTSRKDLISIVFDGKPPEIITLYHYWIYDTGRDKSRKYTPSVARNVIFTNFFKQKNKIEFQLRPHPASLVDSDLSSYRGVRLICKQNGHKVEYVFAYRVGLFP